MFVFVGCWRMKSKFRAKLFMVLCLCLIAVFSFTACKDKAIYAEPDDFESYPDYWNDFNDEMIVPDTSNPVTNPSGTETPGETPDFSEDEEVPADRVDTDKDGVPDVDDSDDDNDGIPDKEDPDDNNNGILDDDEENDKEEEDFGNQSPFVPAN